MNSTGLQECLSAVRGRVVRASFAVAALLATAVIAAGCQMEPPRVVERAALSFAALPPLIFDLDRIEVTERPTAPHPSDVAHLFPTPPAVGVKRWVEDRLRASGTAGLLRVTVDEASARITPLETNTDLEGLFTEEQNERLDVRLRVTIEAVDDTGTVRGRASTDARRSRTLPEGITFDEREVLYDQIIGALLHDYNESQEQAIRRYLYIYLR